MAPLGSPAFFRDPYRTYRAWFSEGTRVLRMSPRIVAVTHYQDCLDILRDPGFSARRNALKPEHYTKDQIRALSESVRVSGNMMFFMDPPEHTRIRKLLMRAFSPDAMAALAPRIEALFRDLLDTLPAGAEIDFMGRVAHPFPALVIGEILGVPQENWDRLIRWSDIFIEIFATFQPSFELALEGERATADMLDFLQQIAERKRAEPGDDVISMMLKSEDGDVLTRDELLAGCMQLLVAGHETTRNLLGNGLLTLLLHPGELARLRQDPGMVRSAVEELLRFEGPLQATSRVSLTGRELYGEPVPAGHSVVALVGCANRDPLQFPDPDRLDLSRRNNAHLAFGAGIHNCLGSHLARLEAQIAFPALLQRFPRIELRDDRFAWTETLKLRGLKSLNVVLS